MTIAAVNRKVQDAVSRRQECFEWAVDDFTLSEMMVSMMQERLFGTGTNSDGTEIRPFYTRYTQEIKEEKGQPYDRVTLKDTGAFYAAMYAEADGDKVVFGSTDEKTDEDTGDIFLTQERLEEKYGDRIFGLTEENKIETRAYTARSIREWFFLQTGL